MSAHPEQPLALTAGEPAGIGPDLCVMLAARGFGRPVTVVADPDLLASRAATLGIEVSIKAGSQAPTGAAGELHVTPVRLASRVRPGQLDPANAPYILATLDAAIEGCLQGRFAGMVTAPLHKGIINDAGIPFSGHTEYLAECCNVQRVVMMLAAGNLRVALATTHLPLRQVADAINRDDLRTTLGILDADLRQKFALPSPKIVVLGLNPHAGEGGHLGGEEISIISPVIDSLRAEGMNLLGPLPADTAFTPRVLASTDAVLAMYHDQGLPVLKHAGFGSAVNVTLGLPIIRTSVDHGTALELAGTGDVDTGSLDAALDMAADMHARCHGMDPS
ncbi:MAG: 4-hydroxythreonine-4-phosphate dehydrogenase PdxA [Gammaproteobacteria bacterium]|nr:4-hydroxythreonine-4-phosphate dehydrogenase PdxA [Gammaproteobacteria bacterium]